ncbi:hypothetical protein SPHINGOT1_260027 [Sphingomonas sp. T1]|nr:hypothetical protein SPHINGOT1_260027 [Sphingomonas sp. T1]
MGSYWHDSPGDAKGSSGAVADAGLKSGMPT